MSKTTYFCFTHRNLILLVCLCLFLISSISPLHSQEKTSKERGRTEEIDATADKMEFKKEENIFVGKGNVKISYGDILIKA
ncbi:MAG: hypothetical protein U9O87_10820, partial [Verrucomicrobiota bacterium]|nr:hypothetical protein [Verrucomicrobiota bacterium]